MNEHAPVTGDVFDDPHAQADLDTWTLSSSRMMRNSTWCAARMGNARFHGNQFRKRRPALPTGRADAEQDVGGSAGQPDDPILGQWVEAWDQARVSKFAGTSAGPLHKNRYGVPPEDSVRGSGTRPAHGEVAPTGQFHE